ncbi:PDZ and LIM domain protein 7-like isoform X1 [Glandiceps talaboti]
MSVCHNCNEAAYGMVLNALGHKWHPQCFVCSQCKEEMAGKTFYKGKDGKPLCEDDYAASKCPTCAGCKDKIYGEVLTAMKMKWHVKCFACTECREPFEQGRVYLNQGKPYCLKDYERKFLGGKRKPETCQGCKKGIVNRWVDALGGSWHPECFVCTQCSVTLQGTSFFKENETPYCAKCAHEANRQCTSVES